MKRAVTVIQSPLFYLGVSNEQESYPYDSARSGKL